MSAKTKVRMINYLIIFYLGTPWVIFIEATPAKWNVFNVICVPGSPILWAAIAPTGVPIKNNNLF